jgi:Tol biopolymer transport system component
VLPVTPDGKPVPGESPRQWTHAPFNKKIGRFSPEPNPRWIAYQSDESGRYEIYVDSFPTPRNKVRISVDGGVYPEWSPGGRELFFTSPQGGVMAVNLKTAGDSLQAGEPHELFRLPDARVDPDSTAFQVSPDGQRFLVRAAPEEAADPLSIILNWPALLMK